MNKELQELPKKKDTLDIVEMLMREDTENLTKEEVGELCFNQCLALVKPIHQKQVLRIAELEHRKFMDDFGFAKIQALREELEAIKKKYTCEFCGSTNMVCKDAWVKERDKLKAEITRLKQKEELDVNKVEEVILQNACSEDSCIGSKDMAKAICSKFKRDTREELDVGGLARNLHEWYLEAITSGVAGEQYNPNAVKSYDDLTDEQRAIDKYIATSIVSRFSLGNKELLGVLKVIAENIEGPKGWQAEAAKQVISKIEKEG